MNNSSSALHFHSNPSMSFFSSFRYARGYAIAMLLLTATSFAQKHIVQPADIAALKTIEAPKISPDGRMVAYTVSTPQLDGKPREEHIWIVNTDQPGSARLFISGAGSDRAPAWSPDGKYLAFLSDRPNPLSKPESSYIFSLIPGTYPDDIPKELTSSTKTPPKNQQPAGDDEKSTQLWIISMDGGEARPLTNLPGDIRSFKWSKDGKHIAFLRTDTDTPEQRDRKKKKDDREIIDGEYHYDRLWIYDMETRQARLLTRQDANVDAMNWSPDGTSLVARVSPTPRIDDYWRVSVVEIFDASSGSIREVLEQHSGYEEPMYSPDGTMITYSRFTEKRITDMHLVRTLSTGADVKLEDKLPGTLAEIRWIKGNRLLVNSYVHAHTEAYEVNPKTLATTKLNGMPLTSEDLDATEDGSAITFLGETSTQPAEVSVWQNDHVVVLTDTNPQTKDWALGERREVQWTNSKDHMTIYGVLSLPPGYVPGKRYKTAIHLHGGPEEAFTVGFNASWYNYATLLASQGYVVLQPDYRGSAGQSIDFTEANYKDWGGGDFADVMAGADWVIAQGMADPDQMVIAGWSYGGFMTSWAVTHTDRFKAAMAGAPVTDVFSMAITTDIAPSYPNSYMGPFAASKDELDRHSPVRYAANCHTPVLVLQGQADVRVPLAQGQEFYHALRYTGAEAAMVTYPREPHIFTEPEHQIDSLTRELSWFSSHLNASEKK